MLKVENGTDLKVTGMWDDYLLTKKSPPRNNNYFILITFKQQLPFIFVNINSSSAVISS